MLFLLFGGNAAADRRAATRLPLHVLSRAAPQQTPPLLSAVIAHGRGYLGHHTIDRIAATAAGL
ncbi:hypothetical protein ACWDE9_05410, partial [Streptomyces olivaceoviridis]